MSETSRLDRIIDKAPDLEFELNNGLPVVKLGVIITLYFCGGHLLESKKKVLECFAGFRDEFGWALNEQYHNGFRKTTDSSVEKTTKNISKTSAHELYHWWLSSANTAQEAGTYTLSVLNAREFHTDSDRSFIKLTLPWSVLNDADTLNGYHQWLLYLCNQVQADHGYGGLSSILPYDHSKYAPTEFQLAQQYSGLEVTPCL